MDLLHMSAYNNPERILAPLEEHREIIKALSSSDTEAADRAMFNHIKNAEQERLLRSKQ